MLEDLESIFECTSLVEQDSAFSPATRVVDSKINQINTCNDGVLNEIQVTALFV